MNKSDNMVPCRLVGLCVESENSRLRRVAMEKHAQWLATPTESARRAYGLALGDWARGVRNRAALKYAQELL